MVLNNGEKSVHGRNAQESLDDLLQLCKEKDLIASYIKKFSIGRDGYSSDQFYAPFLIAFEDGEKWIIYSSTSMRTDRIKGQQWDSRNIKDIDPIVTKSFLVYADSLPREVINEFIRQGKKYTEGTEYSSIDNIISQEELYGLIEHRAFNEIESGKKTSLAGALFESRVANTLSSYDNLELWKNSYSLNTGIHFTLFKVIVSAWNLIPEKVIKIDATADDKIIGRLPSGGKPKTDVLALVTFADQSTQYFTISCKRSTKMAVSVHQYTADKFADVLDSRNEELRRLLNLFQINGTLSDFGKENSAKLAKCLKPYLKKFSLWVLGGQRGDGIPETQWADYILTYNVGLGQYSIHSINEYYQILLDNGVSGNFGTVFNWTYASGHRGKDIQLKVKVI